MEKELRIGDGFDPKSTQGPLINQRAVEKIESLVTDSRTKGAKIVVGGVRKGMNFYEPTLISDVSTSMKSYTEEQFGPVAVVIRFKTEEEAIYMANNTTSGLAGYVFTENISQMWRIVEKLEFGIVGVNEGLPAMPEAIFGGWKESGLGREGRDQTVQKVKERYFWRGMLKDISNFVKKCKQCQYTNTKTETTLPEMTSVPI